MPPVLPKIAEPLRSLTSSGIHSLRECSPDQRGVVRSAVRRRKGRIASARGNILHVCSKMIWFSWMRSAR